MTMSVDNLSLLDLVVLVVFLFSTFVLVRSHGWKRGGLFLGLLFVAGILIAIATSILGSNGKYIAAAVIVLIGFLLRKQLNGPG